MSNDQNHRSHYFGPGNGMRYSLFAYQCVCYCSMLGFGFGMMGVVMTSVAYGGTFNDTPLNIIGPLFLTLSMLVICIAICLCIYARKKTKTEVSQPTQGGPAQYPAANVPYSYPAPYPVAPQYAPPDVYDPSKRGLIPVFPSSSAPGPEMHSTVEQPSYNPNFAPPSVEKPQY